MGATVYTDTLDDFKNDWLLLSDFIDMWCGKELGNGTSRVVYEFRQNDKLVVKIDRTKNFNNVSEWDIWNNINHHHPKIAAYLAPCISISNAGKIMLQAKTVPIKKEELPKKIPQFLADTKIQNWGRIGKRIVCHDYANSRLYRLATTKMVTPNWWSDNVSAPVKYMKNK